MSKEGQYKFFDKNVFLAIITFCLFALLIVIILGFFKWKDRIRPVKCSRKNETFYVQNNKEEPEWVRQEAADRLADLAERVDKLVLYVYNNNLPNSKVAHRLANRWKRIRTNPSGFREISQGEKTAAYTVNKGEQMRICIRDENKKNIFEDPNDSFFVILHELGHLMSKSYGHNLEFKRNFAYITRIAVELGLYNYVDYSKKPTTYCNVDITNTAY